MSFNKIYEITCDSCRTLLVHVYSVEQARTKVQDAGWHTKGRKHYCSDSCLESKL